MPSHLPTARQYTSCFSAILVATLTACASPRSGPEPTLAATSAANVTKLADAPDQFFTSGDARLRYRDYGRGSPVVLIHGWARSLGDWLALADSFAIDHRVIAFDVRGFGQSTKFADPARFGRVMSDDVVSLLDHLKIKRAHLVGHSMGALIAANVAARYPKRVASASLIAGPFHPDSATFAGETARWAADLERGEGLRHFITWLFPGMPDSIARGVSAQALAENELGTLLATLRAMGALTVGPDQASLATVPVFVAVGSNDPLAPHSRNMARWWPRAKFVELARVNHVQIVTRPEVLEGMRTLMK